MKIEWLPVVGYEGIYLVSNDGQVMSLPRETLMPRGGIRRDGGKVLKQKKDKDGYLVTTLCGLYGEKTVKVHRLVAAAFLPNPFNLPMVNHLDRNMSNNHELNLEWTTAAGNAHHSMNEGVVYGNFTSPRNAKGRYS